MGLKPKFYGNHYFSKFKKSWGGGARSEDQSLGDLPQFPQHPVPTSEDWVLRQKNESYVLNCVPAAHKIITEFMLQVKCQDWCVSFTEFGRVGTALVFGWVGERTTKPKWRESRTQTNCRLDSAPF